MKKEDLAELSILSLTYVLQVCHLDSTEIVYATYHVDVGETPFFIGVDYDKSRVVISIRGTLSMQVYYRGSRK